MSDKVLEELVAVLTNNNHYDLIESLRDWWEAMSDSDYEPEFQGEPKEEYQDDGEEEEELTVAVDKEGFLFLTFEDDSE